MTPDLKVFLCGTFADLQEERKLVLQMLEGLGLRRKSMEHFGARDQPPLEVCLDEVRKSDLLVVVVGHHYGSIAPEIGMSFSEAEYRAALDAGKPCYVFLASLDQPLPPRALEQDPDKARLLLAWKQMLCDRHTVAYFTSPSELSVRVLTAINRVLAAQQSVAAAHGATGTRPTLDHIVAGIDDLLQQALDTGYPPGVLVGAIRAALSSFAVTNDRLGVRVVLLGQTPRSNAARILAEALEKEGADVVVEPLEDFTLQPGDLTAVLTSAEVVVVFASTSTPTDSWVKQELEAAMWRFIAMPHSVMVIPVAFEGASVPPLLRALPHLALNDDSTDKGVADIVAAIRKHKTERDDRGTGIVRAAGLLRARLTPR